MAAHNHHGARAPGLAVPELARVPAAGLAPLGAPGAAPAGLTTTHKDEAPGWQAEGDEGNTEPNNCDSAHHAPQAQPYAAAHKVIVTLQARAALLGHVLLPGVDDQGNPVFFASRWGMSRQLSSVAEVEAFLLRVGGRKRAEAMGAE